MTQSERRAAENLLRTEIDEVKRIAGLDASARDKALERFAKRYHDEAALKFGFTDAQARHYVAARCKALGRIAGMMAKELGAFEVRPGDVDVLIKDYSKAVTLKPTAKSTFMATARRAAQATADGVARFIERIVVQWGPGGEPVRVIERPISAEEAELAIAAAQPPAKRDDAPAKMEIVSMPERESVSRTERDGKGKITRVTQFERDAS